MQQYRVDPYLLPDEVLEKVTDLQLALIQLTDYATVQVTLTGLRNGTFTRPVFDVQVEEQEDDTVREEPS